MTPEWGQSNMLQRKTEHMTEELYHTADNVFFLKQVHKSSGRQRHDKNMSHNHRKPVSSLEWEELSSSFPRVRSPVQIITSASRRRDSCSRSGATSFRWLLCPKSIDVSATPVEFLIVAAGLVMIFLSTSHHHSRPVPPPPPLLLTAASNASLRIKRRNSSSPSPNPLHQHSPTAALVFN